MMEIDHKLQFSNLMAKACAAYQTKPLDKETMRVYYENLSDVPVADLERNLKAHIKSQRFFPKVSDLISKQEEVCRPMLGSPYKASHRYPHAHRAANLVLYRVLIRRGGVDSQQMKLLSGMKSALVEELGSDNPTNEWLSDVEEQLWAIAVRSDDSMRDDEAFEARVQFCINRGMEPPVVAN